MANTTETDEDLTMIYKKYCENRKPCPKSIYIAVSCSALFDLSDDLKVYESQGLDAYLELQIEREHDLLKPGTVFPFIKALEYVNKQLMKLDDAEVELFDIVLLSPNRCRSGLRLVRSLKEHGLLIQRLHLTDGSSFDPYLKASNVQLFLSTSADHVREALALGIAAAVVTNQEVLIPEEDKLRIVFDLDSVIFDDETENILEAEGLPEYIKHERNNGDRIIGEGPFKTFAMAIGRLQDKFRKNCGKLVKCPLRTYAVTSRGATMAESALKTLRHWGLDIDEGHFLALCPKSDILKVIRPHIFFDDSSQNIQGAKNVGVPAGHVLRR